MVERHFDFQYLAAQNKKMKLFHENLLFHTIDSHLITFYFRTKYTQPHSTQYQ